MTNESNQKIKEIIMSETRKFVIAKIEEANLPIYETNIKKGCSIWLETVYKEITTNPELFK